MCDERGFVLVYGVIYIYSTFVNFYVLEIWFDVVYVKGRDRGIREREEGNIG